MTEGVQLVVLPFKGKDLSMIVLVPDHDLSTLVTQLASGALDSWLAQPRLTNDVGVTFPKFTIAGNFGLGGVLQTLGVTDAFDPDLADFSGVDGMRDHFWTAPFTRRGSPSTKRGPRPLPRAVTPRGTTLFNPRSRSTRRSCS